MFKKILVTSLALSFCWASTSFSKSAHSVRKPSSGSRIGSSTLSELSVLAKDELPDITRVQNFVEIKKISNGRIGLIQVDSGGSTDVSAAMASSGIYLTFFKDGEMHNLKAAFNLGGLNEFKIISNENSTLKLQVKCKDEKLKDKKTDIVINYADYEKAFTISDKNSIEGDSQDIIIPGKITVSDQCLPLFE